MEFPKRYDPTSFEARVYQNWESQGVFAPIASTTGKTYYIPMPPPNVTGNLHIGHSLFITLQDILVRFHRMRGDETIWIPGTDHAGISTQTRVEKKLLQAGIRRQDLGREKFLEKVWEWKNEYGANILHQIRRMGASCDWSSERFTFDTEYNKLVEFVFVDLYNKGLIYRGEYMVNYSPGLESVISDAEVEYKEEDAKLYYITYFVSGSDNELIVATTRPETLLADQAIAVHPKDKRFKKLIGKSVILPIVNKEIPIIGDEMVDMEFGTGAVKITPAHDPADFEVAKRHNLRTDYAVLDRRGMMNRNAGIFAGQDAQTARDNIVELLKAKGNLGKIEPYRHKVGYCSMTGVRIESVVSTQWFARASKMSEKVMAGYKKGDFAIIPERYRKIFEDWMNNLHDWCISRQLWWGHRIPAYYDAKTGELLAVTQDEANVFAKYGKENVRQDEDVLDTWFSSALWPFSVLDWDPTTGTSPRYAKYYPAQMLETGHDILFFWIIRMLLMGYEYTGQTPFTSIYLHGLVLDDQGRKMSKSWGNVVDPLTIIEELGTDALRLSLAIGTTPGNNQNFSTRNVEQQSLFLNKLWNIARFAAMNAEGAYAPKADLENQIQKAYKAGELMPHERWILSRLRTVTDEATQGLENNDFSLVGSSIIHFIRDEFADFFIEEFKVTRETSRHGKTVLMYTLVSLLQLLHPYAPFITEELGIIISNGELSLITSPWPTVVFERDVNLEKDFALIEAFLREIRNFRAVSNLKPSDSIDISLYAPKNLLPLVSENQTILSGLLGIGNFEIVAARGELEKGTGYLVVGDLEIAVHTEAKTEEVVTKLDADIADRREYIRILDAKLLDNSFLEKAPERIVRAEQDKRRQAQEQLTRLLEKRQSITL